ncbi:hypothetical protein BJ742DRAFT_771730 [Cladochytrium replicatum]|nr:hypothetical protein BJ742DRAFT_771730 [Cladochytrium replicatum]
MSPVPTWTNVNGAQQRPSWQSGRPKSNETPPLDFLSKKPLRGHHPDFADTSSSKLLPLPPPPPWPGTRAPHDHNTYPYHEPILPPLHLHHYHHPVRDGHLSIFFDGSSPHSHGNGSRSLPALIDAGNHHITDAPAQYIERREHRLDSVAELADPGRAVHSALDSEAVERLVGRSERAKMDGITRVGYHDGHSMPIPHRYNAEIPTHHMSDQIQLRRPDDNYERVPYPRITGSLPAPPTPAQQKGDPVSDYRTDLHQQEKRLVRRQRSSDTFSMPSAQKRAKTSKDSESPVESSSTSPESQAITTLATTSTTNSGKPKPPRKFKCTAAGCDKSFTSSGHLVRHQRTHTGARPFACPLPECGARFSRHDNMQQHYRSHLHKLLESQEVKLTLVNPRSNMGPSGIPISYDELTSGKCALFNTPSLSSLASLPRPTRPMDLQSQFTSISTVAEHREASHFASGSGSSSNEYGHDRYRGHIHHQPLYRSEMHSTTSAPPQLPPPAEMSHLDSYQRPNHISLSSPERTYDVQSGVSSSFQVYPTSMAGYNGRSEPPLPSMYDPNGPRR